MDLTRMRDGQAVEALSHDFVRRNFVGDIQSQVTFATDTLTARADFICASTGNGSQLIEVKASTKVKEGGGADHIVDAAFQLLVAERSGWVIDRVFLVHLNADYSRDGDLDVGKLFVLVDITDKARDRLSSLHQDMDAAAKLLGVTEIDEDGCDCRFASVSNRCAGFDHFNPSIPVECAHYLPRISSTRLRKLDGCFDLRLIEAADLTNTQARAHRAFVEGPQIDQPAIRVFLESATYPLHFYDFETTGPAVPPERHYRPYLALPVQFSLHRMAADGGIEHFEWLADGHGQQLELIEQLQSCVLSSGSVFAWHKSFENGCNERLIKIFPEKSDFLSSLIQRTLDLEDPFKRDFVHWGFRGSSSIKKVLPILCPDLFYPRDGVNDGTSAVEAWNCMIESDNGTEKTALREQLLNYCRLDSWAMVRIYQSLSQASPPR